MTSPECIWAMHWGKWAFPSAASIRYFQIKDLAVAPISHKTNNWSLWAKKFHSSLWNSPWNQNDSVEGQLTVFLGARGGHFGHSAPHPGLSWERLSIGPSCIAVNAGNMNLLSFPPPLSLYLVEREISSFHWSPLIATGGKFASTAPPPPLQLFHKRYRDSISQRSLMFPNVPWCFPTFQNEGWGVRFLSPALRRVTLFITFALLQLIRLFLHNNKSSPKFTCSCGTADATCIIESGLLFGTKIVGTLLICHIQEGLPYILSPHTWNRQNLRVPHDHR